MGIDEGEEQVGGVFGAVAGDFLPAVADIDAFRFQAPQQGDCIGQVEIVAGFLLAHTAVVEIEHRIAVAEFDMKQRAVPPQVEAEILDLGPVRLEAGQPGDALRPAGPASP